MLKKAIAILLTLILFILPFSGCGNNKAAAVYYDLDSAVTSLDPQFTTQTSAYTVLYNLFDGLLIQLPSGEIIPGVSESYTVSEDGLTYTFTLKDSLTWSDGTALTAEDFVFAFGRLFDSRAVSPHAVSFICLKNASSILNGSAPLTSLGVQAPDPKTVVFTLETANPFFPELLCSPAAFPCQQAFFLSTKGRYGADYDFLLANGPLTLRSWDTEKQVITLKPNTHHPLGNDLTTSRVTLYGKYEGSANERFFKDVTDGCAIRYDQLGQLASISGSYQAFEDTTWAIVINTQSEVYANQNIRTALLQSIERSGINEYIDAHYTLTASLVPRSALVIGEPYRDMVGIPRTSGYQPSSAKERLEAGLLELGLDKLPKTTFLVPDSDEHAFYMGFVQQRWQKDLSAFINTQPMSVQNIEKQVASGNFDIALIPIKLQSSNPYSLLSNFVSGSSSNLVKLQNATFDDAIDQAVHAADPNSAAQKLFAAEEILLNTAAVIPIYAETSYYAVAKKVTQIHFSPFTGKVLFYTRETNGG